MRTHISAVPTAPARPGQVKRWKRVLREQLAAYLFLLPALLLFVLFAWYPILRGMLISFQRLDLLGNTTWVGLASRSRR